MVLPLIARGIARGINATIGAIGTSHSGGSNGIRLSTRVEGVAELSRQFNQLGNLKQKSITKASKQGANIALKYARKFAPEDTGLLKKSLRLIGEKKARSKKKKVYQVTFDKSYNDVLQKPIKEPGKYGGKKPWGYVPMSQEYGFLHAGGFVPGYGYLRKSLKNNKTEIEGKINSVLLKEIDKNS